jgi:hypothetical protein
VNPYAAHTGARVNSNTFTNKAGRKNFDSCRLAACTSDPAASNSSSLSAIQILRYA